MSVPKLIDATDPKYKAGSQAYSFSYMPLGDSWLRSQGWRNVRARFDSVKDAAEAASAWMMVCHDNDFPIAVKITEVK